MLVTLFCDASRCPETGIGGWGAWVKVDGWEKGKTFGGALPAPYPSAHVTELVGIARAVRHLDREGALHKASAIMVQTDCVRALEVILATVPGSTIARHKDSAHFTRRRLIPDHHELHAAEEIARLTDGMMLMCRHVRGHKRGENRQWVNRVCDKIAKRHMRVLRQSNSGYLPTYPQE